MSKLPHVTHSQHERIMRRAVKMSMILFFEIRCTGWAKNRRFTVSQQIVLQCMPIKIVLPDLSVTHVVSRKHIMF